MNSLSYLSRQFDVLASAKTPPSTPTSRRRSFLDGSHPATNPDGSLPRVRSWSTKSFFSPSQIKRSFSSPAVARTPVRSPTHSPPLPPRLETSSSPKSALESLLGRLFIARVFMMAWNTLRSALITIFELTYPTKNPPISLKVVIERERDTSDEEASEEASASSSTKPLQTYPPIPPSLPSEPLLGGESSPDSSTSAAAGGPQPAVALQPPPASAETNASRSSTPALSTRKTPFHLPKTLVLDLDETLIHSTSRPMAGSSTGTGFFGLEYFGRKNKGVGHVVEVVLGGRSTIYHVYKRPFVDFFLRTVSSWYTLVIFTASMQEYADPVIDWLDAGRGLFSHRFFRDSCTQMPNGSYTKDLSIIEPDLARVCLVDNSPISYHVNEVNGIPIEGWTDDPSDEALLDLLPVLDSLRFTSDVRRILGLRTMGSHQ